VVKDAGDDPDVTHGAEIHAESILTEASADGTVIIRGGTGVGRITKPGLAVPVGEWAINPVPRRMITEVVNEVFSLHCPLFTGHCAPVLPQVTISIPNGQELAKKTLNARLGIVGGLSILGTTGIVKPISSKAWTDTIDASIDVALACGGSTLVLSTGRTSELAAQHFFSRADRSEEGAMNRASTPLSEESYIMMGDHVGHTLRACERKGVQGVILAAQFAKLLKIACGHEQTHVFSSTLDLRTLADWLRDSPRASHLAPLASRSATAREVFESSEKNPELSALVRDRAAVFAGQLAPSLRVQVFLAGYGGEMVYFR
jgi:cobalt-precorrin-5B (C1)-methyltransferase